MMRSKINDEFQFPEHINMAPYTVEHLSNPEQPIEPDMFELVGVLVHNGTAESGHYYSYTVERPSPNDGSSWVEFNDSEVSRFDPNRLSDHCFGGYDPPQYPNGNPKVKGWNAYMLFYQRVSAIEQSKSIYVPSKPGIPAHIPVSVSVQSHIAMDNELLIRTYCLLDPQYAFFVRRLLQRWSHMAQGDNKIKTETLAVNVGMDTLEQLVSRTKELQGYDDIYRALVDMIETSSNAAQSALQWLSDRQTSMRNLMTKTNTPEIRGKQQSVIQRALSHLHSLSTDSTTEDDDKYAWHLEFLAAVERIVGSLTELWPNVQCIPRVWDDYFAFFSNLCSYGPSSVQVLLDQGVFVMCLHIFWIDADDLKGLTNRYANYMRLLEKGRQFSYSGLLSLCLIFFKHLDLSIEPTPRGGKRKFLTETGKFSPRESELDLITPVDKDECLILLVKILKHWTNLGRTHTARAIVAALLAGEPQAGLLHAIQKTMEGGLRLDPAVDCVAFLEASVTFCEHCPDEDRVIEVIKFIANGVVTIDNSGGQEHMDFFTQIRGITNQRLKHLDSRAFTKLAIDYLPIYAPTLLIDRDESVRQNIQTILTEVFAGTIHETTTPMETQQNGEEKERQDIDKTVHVLSQAQLAALGRQLQKACAERLTAAFLRDPIRSVDAKQLESIIDVMNYCLNSCYGESEEDKTEVKQTRGM